MRALLLAALAAAGCAKARGVVVGTGDDPMSVIGGELLHVELAARPEGARRQRCGDLVDCVARLRGGAIDVMVIERDELSVLVPDKSGLEVVAELPVERRFVLAGSGPIGAGDRRARIAVAPDVAARAGGEVAELTAALSVPVTTVAVAAFDDRRELLEAGVVDGAVFEWWRRPPGTAELASARGSHYVVVANTGALARGRDWIPRASGALVVRLEKLGGRLLSAVGGGLDPIEAVDRFAPRKESPEAPLELARAPRHQKLATLLARALAARSVELVDADDPAAALAAGRALALVDPGAHIEGAERIAAFDAGGRPVAELWARVGTLELADARRVLDASPRARMPSGSGPSLWQRATGSGPTAPRGASRWFDTLVNVLTGTFLVWLLVTIIRRGPPAA